MVGPVVTKDILSFVIVSGVPTKVIKELFPSNDK